MKRILSFLLLFTLLLPCVSAEENQSLQILSTNSISYFPALQDYSAAGNEISYRKGTFNDIVTALSTKDPTTDIFIFQTNYGLDQIKRLKYYYPLTDNESLMTRLQDLYPVFQQGLLDGDDLVGWYLDAQPWGWDVLSPSLLEEAGLDEPTTFDELLDVCNALLESGLLGRNYTLMSEYPYTQEGMLNFYVTQFIMASEMTDGQVNFLRPEFARIANKIKETVPEKRQENEMAFYEVFTSTAAFLSPNTHIELIPTPLDDVPSRLYYLTVIAIINPYSQHLDEATDLMLYLASDKSVSSYLWDSTLNQPHIYDNYDEIIADLESQIAVYEAMETLSEDDEFMLDAARHTLQHYLDDPYDIHEEDVAYYQSIVQNAYISGDSPVRLDDTLKTLIKRYLAGAFDADGFAAACQQHVNSIYLELGMELAVETP